MTSINITTKAGYITLIKRSGTDKTLQSFTITEPVYSNAIRNTTHILGTTNRICLVFDNITIGNNIFECNPEISGFTFDIHKLSDEMAYRFYESYFRKGSDCSLKYVFDNQYRYNDYLYKYSILMVKYDNLSCIASNLLEALNKSLEERVSIYISKNKTYNRKPLITSIEEGKQKIKQLNKMGIKVSPLTEVLYSGLVLGNKVSLEYISNL